MVDSPIERFRRLYDYERDSHAQVLASLTGVPADLRASEAYRRAVTLLAHIVEARRLWLYRLGVAREGPTSEADFFPAHVSMTELATRLDEVQAAWAEYLAGLTDADVARVFAYRSLEGPRFQNSVEDILTQLYGHSLYHRGQIALLLRSIGAEPAATDYVFWARTPLADD